MNNLCKYIMFFLLFSTMSYAQEKTAITKFDSKSVKLFINQVNNLTPSILRFELINLTTEIIYISAMGFKDNRIILENASDQIGEYFIYAKSEKIEIQPKSTKTWDVDIDELLNLFNDKGFQKPDVYTIKWKLVYRDVNRQKHELMSEPFIYTKKSNPDLAFKLRVKEDNNSILMLYVSNFGDGDTINVSNQYDMIVTDSKGCSIIYYPKEKSKPVSLLNSRFHVFYFKIDKILKSYKSTGLQQSGEYTIQWKFSYSYSDKKEYEITSPEFTYTKD